VVALPRDRELDPHTIASALDTGLPLGPAFDRITSEVDVPTLIGSLSLARTDYARERLCILLAHHRNAREAIAALETIVAFVDSTDLALRRGAAYAMKTILGRIGSRRVEASAPGLASRLQDQLAQEDDPEVRDDIAAALGALGQEPPRSSDAAAASFIGEAKAALAFLVYEYGFEEPTVEDAPSSTSLTYRNETTGLSQAPTGMTMWEKCSWSNSTTVPCPSTSTRNSRTGSLPHFWHTKSQKRPARCRAHVRGPIFIASSRARRLH